MIPVAPSWTSQQAVCRPKPPSPPVTKWLTRFSASGEVTWSFALFPSRGTCSRCGWSPKKNSGSARSQSVAQLWRNEDPHGWPTSIQCSAMPGCSTRTLRAKPSTPAPSGLRRFSTRPAATLLTSHTVARPLPMACKTATAAFRSERTARRHLPSPETRATWRGALGIWAAGVTPLAGRCECAPTVTRRGLCFASNRGA